MARWPRDNQADLIRFYGTPGPQVEAQLVAVIPPFQMYYDGKPIRHIRFHKKAAPALKAALDEIWEHYGKDQRKIDSLGISKYAGAYNPRKIRGSATKWSNHAYGAAIDLNAAENGFGKGKGSIPQPVIDAFKRQGARWGGDYVGRTDPMHFEFCDAGNARPLTLIDGGDDVQADGDSDVQEETAVVPVDVSSDALTQHIEESAERDVEPRASWLKRKWRGVTGWLSGAGATGALGYFTDPWAIVAVIGCLFLILIIFVLFMGPGEVRAWIRKQVA